MSVWIFAWWMMYCVETWNNSIYTFPREVKYNNSCCQRIFQTTTTTIVFSLAVIFYIFNEKGRVERRWTVRKNVNRGLSIIEDGRFPSFFSFSYCYNEKSRLFQLKIGVSKTITLMYFNSIKEVSFIFFSLWQMNGGRCFLLCNWRWTIYFSNSL